MAQSMIVTYETSSGLIQVDLHTELGLEPGTSIHPNFHDDLWDGNAQIDLGALMHCTGACAKHEPAKTALEISAEVIESIPEVLLDVRDLSTLCPLQRDVNSVVVEHYRRGGLPAETAEYHRVPVLVRIGGQTFILNGTHRIVAAHLDGMPLSVRLIDLG